MSIQLICFPHVYLSFLFRLNFILQMEELLEETLIIDDKDASKPQSLGESWSQINIKMKQTLNMIEKRGRSKHSQNDLKQSNLKQFTCSRNILKLNDKQNRSVQVKFNQKVRRNDENVLKYKENIEQNRVCSFNILNLGAQRKENQIIEEQRSQHSNNKRLLPLLQENQKQQIEKQTSKQQTNQIKLKMVSDHLNIISMKFRMKKSFSEAFNSKANQNRQKSLFSKRHMILPIINLNPMNKKAINRISQSRQVIHSVDKTKSFDNAKGKLSNIRKKSLEKMVVNVYKKKVIPFKLSLNPFKLQLKHRLAQQ